MLVQLAAVVTIDKQDNLDTRNDIILAVLVVAGFGMLSVGVSLRVLSSTLH